MKLSWSSSHKAQELQKIETKVVKSLIQDYTTWEHKARPKNTQEKFINKYFNNGMIGNMKQKWQG